MIEISPASLKIDAAGAAAVIRPFIRDKMVALRRTGIVVPVSGGLDSSVTAALCVDAVGSDKVVGLMLPEKQGNPEASRFGRQIAEYLKIRTETINISPMLRALGTYRFALSFLPGRRLKESVVRSFLDRPGESLFIKALKGEGDRLVRHGVASFYTKQRIRLVATCKYADENNLMVVGSAHKSEDLVGLFVKFGVDDAADVMPLKNLYRSHVLQLAEWLGIPAEISGRTPNPDLIPGVSDKYRDILSVPFEEVDLILYGIEHDVPTEDIAAGTGIDEERVQRVVELYELSEPMRHPSMAPVIPGIG